MNDVFLFDLIRGISKALDYVSTTVTGHHRRVALASAFLARELGLSPTDATDLVLAAFLHDIGAFSLDLKLDGLDFDADLTEHSVIGYRLLKDHPLLNRPASLVRFHHTTWKELSAMYGSDSMTRFLGNALNLMDRIDILAKVGTRKINATHIREVVGGYTDKLYHPDLVDAFMSVSANSEFWDALDNPHQRARDILGHHLTDRLIPQDQLVDFSQFFSRIIDFRSRHTATHSQGVAETAVQLAGLVGMNESDRKRLRLAGNLHDIGKMGVPVTILDKPGQLDAREYDIIKSHTLICEDVLGSIPGLEDVSDWAAQHHERLDGGGYPHQISGEDLSLGSRIMAVADIYTAITEDRPYRDGMPRQQAHDTLLAMGRDNLIDNDLVDLAITNYEQIDGMRRMVQSRAYSEFKRFRTTSFTN